MYNADPANRTLDAAEMTTETASAEGGVDTLVSNLRAAKAQLADLLESSGRGTPVATGVARRKERSAA